MTDQPRDSRAARYTPDPSINTTDHNARRYPMKKTALTRLVHLVKHLDIAPPVLQIATEQTGDADPDLRMLTARVLISVLLQSGNRHSRADRPADTATVADHQEPGGHATRT